MGLLVQNLLYRALGSQELFLCTDGTFRSLANGYLIDLESMHLQVASFAQLHFPSFTLPKQVVADCSRLLLSRVHCLTPAVMRKFLRNFSAASIHAGICLPLLEFCLKDVPLPLPAEDAPIWSEFHGLPVLPLADGSAGVLRLKQQRGKYLLASYNQQQLLPHLGKSLVSLDAQRRLRAYFEDRTFVQLLGLSWFSIKTLADNVDRVLPAHWKNAPLVQWDHEVCARAST